MGWTYTQTINGIKYKTGTEFTLNGKVKEYSSCDASTARSTKTGTAWFYGRFDADYSKHPYCISTIRPGEADSFVDASAFPPATYTVKYNANGGIGAPANQTKKHGEKLTLRSKIPTRACYTFLGWSKSKTATTATYKAGGTYSGNADVTLYAVWKLNTYTVVYDANGGMCATTSLVYDYNAPLTLPVPTRTGYKFVAWCYNSTKGAHATAGTRVTSSFILVAVWSKLRYLITLNANGGVLATEETLFTAEYGSRVELPVVVREGYNFAGWTLDGKGSVSGTNGNYFLTVYNGEATLTAQWTVNAYNVTLDASTNGGTPSKILGYDHGEYVSSKEEALYTPVKPYSVFTGWYRTPEKTNDNPIDLSSLKVESNITLYAQFEEKNTTHIVTEGEACSAAVAVCVNETFIDDCTVMVHVDGAWKKAVAQT